MATTIENVLNLSKLIGGTGGTTTTVSKNVSQDAINAAIRKQLESAQGLASITGGEKTAGLYNSTVAQQLVNDLMSRTAGEAAANTASTTTTVSGSGGIGGQQAGLGLGLLALTDDTFRKTAKEGISSLADVLSGLGSSSVSAMSTVPQASTLAADVFGQALNYTPVAQDAVSALWGAGDTLGTVAGSTSLVDTISSGASDAWDWVTSWF